jgi:hypothetical protein
MCTIEQALPYVALAVLCPAAYEGMARSKLRQLVGASKSVARPHQDDRASEGDTNNP